MRNKTISYFIFCFSLLIISISIQAQPIDSKIKASRQPWNFGVRAGGCYDIATLQQGANYKLGWKVGLVGEKRLIYNIYFQPSLSFQNKGYTYERTYYDKGNVNAYLIEGVAGLLMKFGDERAGKGLSLIIAPYFSYGVGGKSTFEDLRDEATTTDYYGKVTENTFSDYRLKSFDIGFQLGLGYDFNHKWELGGVYNFGLQRMMNYTNFRWRGYQINLTYFFL